MPTYTPITQLTFELAMTNSGFIETPYNGAHELVYTRHLDSRFDIIIFSSITPCNGVSRERGSDAIRVDLYDKENDRVVKLGKRVNRVGKPEAVIERTIERARDVWRHWRRHSCPRCSAVMIPRTRKSDGKPFLGCINFPECRETKEV